MDVRAAILARADLAPLVAARDLDGLAAALNESPSLSVQARFVTMRTIVAECEDADGIITALTSAASLSPSVAEMLRFLRSDSGMDVGHPNTQAKLGELATRGAFTAAQAQAMQSLALQPDTVTRDQVNEAMYNPDGTAK